MSKRRFIIIWEDRNVWEVHQFDDNLEAYKWVDEFESQEKAKTYIIKQQEKALTMGR
jgi:hypothetical protein